jgi:hypothetical protein
MKPTVPTAEIVRLLRRLTAPGARLVRDGSAWRLEVEKGAGRGRIDGATVAAAEGRGLVAPDGETLVITHAGAALVRRALSSGEDFRAQHGALAPESISDDAGHLRHVARDRGESPLSWLRHRRGRDGRPMVEAVEYEAGERLRVDFTRGQLMPRVTANWSAAVAGGRRDGRGGIGDLTDAAVSARQRVERALAAVGPELAGILVDFCCFLHGLEDIERRRGWPVRSAKVVLRLALGALARHYGLSARARGPARAPATLHWGTDDYRPVLE